MSMTPMATAPLDAVYGFSTHPDNEPSVTETACNDFPAPPDMVAGLNGLVPGPTRLDDPLSMPEIILRPRFWDPHNAPGLRGFASNMVRPLNLASCPLSKTTKMHGLVAHPLYPQEVSFATCCLSWSSFLTHAPPGHPLFGQDVVVRIRICYRASQAIMASGENIAQSKQAQAAVDSCGISPHPSHQVIAGDR